MPSSATTRAKFERQATGENRDDWGNRLNTSLDLIDERVDGVATNSGGDFTLAMTNYASSAGREAVQKITGTATTVTLPAVELNRWFHNTTSNAVTITLGSGTTATLKAGALDFIYTDGSTGVWSGDPTLRTLDKFAAPVAAVSMNNQQLTQVANGTASHHAVNLAQLQAQVFAADAIPAGTAVGQVPIWQGSGFLPGALDLADSDARTGVLPVANGGTGAGTEAGARQSILGDTTGNALKLYRVNAAGTDYEFSTAPVPKITTFTASGTYTKNPAAILVMIEAVGAGGSGGRNTSDSIAGGGGGEFVRRILPASAIATTETVTIGAGGAARSTNVAGADGGDTTVGALVTARGGKGGPIAGSPRYGVPGWATGSAGPPTVETSGAPILSWPAGGFSSTASAAGSSVEGGGAGGGVNGINVVLAAGSSVFSGAGGAASATTNVGASNGSAPGGGGGAKYSGGTGNSGAGARGEVRIYEFLGA